MSQPSPLRPGASAAECLTELARMRAVLDQAQVRNRSLEREVLAANASLARIRTELVGTRAEEMRARHEARHDGLTMLPNRSYFLERLDAAVSGAVAGGGPLALLYLDLDGFKPLNDAHGHAAGDELLRIVAARLSREIRGGDMVSRLGGDEFGCLVANPAGREQLGQVAARLVHAVAAPVRIGGLELSVRPSIGIAVCPTDGKKTDDLLRHADAAMYRAKQMHTGYVFFDRRARPRPGRTRLARARLPIPGKQVREQERIAP